MGDLTNEKTIVLTGEEQIVLVDDFISPNAAKHGIRSGRTMRRALQYVLIAMKAAGTNIECHDHEDGHLEDLQRYIDQICDALGLMATCMISKTPVDAVLTLRVADIDAFKVWKEEDDRRRADTFAQEMSFHRDYLRLMCATSNFPSKVEKPKVVETEELKIPESFMTRLFDKLVKK